jgi:hypothetical protein
VSAQLNGCWDIRVHENRVEEFNEPGGARPRAWWLKIEGADTAAPKGEFVSAFSGNLNPIEEISIRGNELVFGFRPKQRLIGGGEGGTRHLVYRARLVGDRLEGTYEVEGQNQPPTKWTGVRAPVIPDKDDGTWRESETLALFNGRDLSGWHPVVPEREASWSARNGVLIATGRGSDLISDKKSWNFKLHLEYKLPPGSNSGIGLRARYEVQIMDGYGQPPDSHSTGALYSRIAPSENASKPAGEWQIYDIRLVGRQVTIVLNGKTVIDKGEIEGLTAIASDPNEGEPGALILQGDHGRVEFRNILMTLLVKM